MVIWCSFSIRVRANNICILPLFLFYLQRVNSADMKVHICVGIIMEHDDPSKLLENKFLLFSNLVAEYTMRSDPSLGCLEDHSGIEDD